MLIPGPDVYLELKMLGTIISAIAYGIVIVLSGNCFLLLVKKRGIYSNRMRIFLVIYVTVMLAISTWAIIQSIWGITLLIFQDVNVPESLLISYSPDTLPLAIWGADGFMIWRCIVLYQDVARGPRVLVVVLLSLLSIFSLACGVLMFVGLNADDSLFTVVLIIFSLLVNIILALLIVLRLVHHQRRIQKVLGAEHGSPYSKIITMCVESSALMLIFSGVYAVLVFEQANGSLIPFLLFPHICVISPLLIVYRVAKGRSMTTTLKSSERATAQIRFNDPPLSLPSSRSEGDV